MGHPLANQQRDRNTPRRTRYRLPRYCFPKAAGIELELGYRYSHLVPASGSHPSIRLSHTWNNQIISIIYSGTTDSTRERPCETLRALAKRSDRCRAGAALVVVAQLQALVLQRRQLFPDQIQRTDHHFFWTQLASGLRSKAISVLCIGDHSATCPLTSTEKMNLSSRMRTLTAESSSGLSLNESATLTHSSQYMQRMASFTVNYRQQSHEYAERIWSIAVGLYLVVVLVCLVYLRGAALVQFGLLLGCERIEHGLVQCDDRLVHEGGHGHG